MGPVLALIGVSAIAGGALSLSLRDGSSTTATPAVEVAEGTGDREAREGDRPRFRRLTARQRLARRRDFHAALAKELDVSTEAVETAFRNLLKKRLDQGVEDGRLTRRQADRMLRCYDTAGCKPPGRRGRHHFGGPPPGGPPPFGGPPM